MSLFSKPTRFVLLCPQWLKDAPLVMQAFSSMVCSFSRGRAVMLSLVCIMHEMHFGIATRVCATTSNTTSLRHMHIHRAQERTWGFKKSGFETVRHLGSGVGGSILECQDHGCAHGRIIQYDVIHSSWVSAQSRQRVHACARYYTTHWFYIAHCACFVIMII